MNKGRTVTTNNLPPGYRMTELGPLPEEWEVVRLGEVVHLETGKRQKGGALSQGKVWSLGGEHVTEFGGIDFWRNPKYVSLVFFHSLRQGKIQSGDTLVVKDGARAGKSAFVERLPVRYIAVNEHLFIMRPIERNRLWPSYLGMWALSRIFWKQVRSAYHGLIGGINRKDLQSFLLPLPPLPEQRAIAYVLRSVQEAKEKTENVINALKELKKSLIKHLFTYGPVPIDEVDKVRLKETEIGKIPEHWEVVRLGKVAEVRGGKRLPKGHKFSETRTPYPYLRVTNFRDGSIDTRNLKYLTPEDHEILKRYTISARDVYISIAGTIGLVGTVPPELDGANLTENAAKLVIVDQHRLSQIYLVYALANERCQAQIQQRATKTSQPKLALTRIRQLLLPLPPLPEQKQIAHILRSVDEKIDAEKKRLEALDRVFKALLNDLMTARRRLPKEFINRFREQGL